MIYGKLNSMVNRSDKHLYAPDAVPAETVCKCCGGASVVVALLDAGRSGVDARAGRAQQTLSGQAVYYYRCTDCGFTFTRAFDHWSADDFAQRIYNADYPRHDPAYGQAGEGERGERTAADVIGQFGAYAAQLAVLDWGSGEGSFAASMRRHGFARVDEYDPFVAGAATRPQGRYDMVTCFEVMEHTLDPLALVADLASHRASDGAILISTLCCSKQVVDFGLENWHYCVPRNGHISFMAPQALMVCAQQQGLVSHSFSAGAHVMFDAAAVPVWLVPKLAPWGDKAC